MLFLGTKKYPTEHDYERFIFDGNGNLNGYTANDHSMYYFSSLDSKALFGALDRFSRFFFEPLFNPSCVQREMKGYFDWFLAVDEEYRKNIESDAWRMLHVRKELANPSHPFSIHC
jgi:insulysin